MECTPVSGSVVLMSQIGIADAEVPRFFIQAQNRWVDNPHSPDYAADQRRVAIERAEAALRCVVRQGCKAKLPEDQRWLQHLTRWGDPLLDTLDMHDPDDVQYLYILREAIGDSGDVDTLVKNCCLVEGEVEKCMEVVGVTRNGSPIHKLGLKHGVQTGIGHRMIVIGESVLVHPSEEYSACTHSGLDWWQWRDGQYSLAFMTETVAYYRIDRLTENHAKDAEATEAERKARQARRK